MSATAHIDFSAEWRDEQGEFIIHGELDHEGIQPVKTFLAAWQDARSFIEVHSSGSTGKPKRMEIPKQWMIASAQLTLNQLNISEGQRALICISAAHIGGMMMMVRAIVGKLNLYILPPSSIPLLDEKIDFTALAPLQVYALWERNGNLDTYGTVIIGGASLNRKWITELKKSQNPIYASYGMTETVSHVALRKISGRDSEDFFQCLPGIKASVGDEQRLHLDIAHFDALHVETQDIVELIDEQRFNWIGRADNVINTGGIKLIPERLEEKLSALLSTEFFISSEEDERLGQLVILCIEGQAEGNQIHTLCKQVLEKHERPRKIYQVKEMKKSASGKILKQETLHMTLLLWSKES